MAKKRDDSTDLLDDFDIESESLPDLEEDLLADQSTQSGSASDEGELEQYGVWVKVKPETILETPEEFKEGEITDLSSEESSLTEEEEDLLSELEEKESSISEPSDIDKLPLADEDLVDLDSGESEDMLDYETSEELPELTSDQDFTEQEEIEVPLSEDISIGEDFEEMLTLKEDLSDIERSVSEDDASSDLLKKIEKELSEIKIELTALKKELSLLREPGSGAENEVSVQPVEEDSKGFFDDEEDETIALTGDELDNILNTADITEEIDKTSSLSEEVALSEGDELTLDESTEEEGLEEVEAAEEEISLELPEEELESLELEEETEVEEGPGLEDEVISLEDGTVSLELPEEEELEDAEAAEIAEAAEEEFEPLEELAEVPAGRSGGAPSPEASKEAAGDIEKPSLPDSLKDEVKTVLSYMDQLLESLPEDKIEEFAKSEFFEVYKRLFEELGIVT